jgi:deoxynucleoside triphosphate triphosphohydrolase SAMHD1
LSIGKLRKLQSLLYPEGDSSLLPYVEAALDSIGFSEDYLQSAKTAAKTAPRKSKVIKDNIWGMAEFGWSSLRLIDSPILQRLRQIRQLGMSYLTYPSAEHSRFSHSLGMACVVEKFIDVSLRVQDADFGQLQLSRLNDNEAETLRHAALLHDIGHFPFSHAVEKAYQYNPTLFACGARTINDFMFLFEEALEIPTPNSPKLSEFLTLTILLCPRFQEFYESCVMGDVASDPDRLYRIASLVVGLPPEESFPGIANLISNSAIDADKIDYIKRDSAACGIPVGIDVARLFLRSAFVTIHREDIERLYSPADPRDTVRLFVVNSSGADTIEEIAQARASLYHRVYLHQATRGVERILTLGLLQGAKVASPTNSLREALFAWALDDVSLLRNLSSLGPLEAELSTRVRNRQLLKKACSIGRDTLEVSFRPTYFFANPVAPHADLTVFKFVVGEALQQFNEDQLQGDKHRDLELLIAREASQLWKSIRDTVPRDLAPITAEATVTVLPVPDFNQTPPDSIINENGFVVQTPKQTNVDELGVAADIFKARGYVSSDLSWRELVFVASRKVLKLRATAPRKIDVRLSGGQEAPPTTIRVISSALVDLDDGARRAGLNRQRLDRIMMAAEQVGYFDDVPALARSHSMRLLQPLAERFRVFNGQGGWTVTALGIAAFLNQFPPRLRDEVTEMINQINMIDRDTIAPAIQALMAMPLSSVPVHHIAPLSPNSGNLVRMIGEQELKASSSGANWTFQNSLAEVFAVNDHNREVLLLDDNAVTGSQVVAQLYAWMGISRDKWPNDVQAEQNIDSAALADRDISLLKKMSVTFGFIFATPEARNRIVETAKSLGIVNARAISYRDMIATTHSPSPELRAFLQDVGEAVLTDYLMNNEPTPVIAHVRAQAAKRALGDGPGCGLLATIFNVPTSTYPALRCPGVFKGQPWVPLFLRRGYLSNLVLG